MDRFLLFFFVFYGIKFFIKFQNWHSIVFFFFKKMICEAWILRKSENILLTLNPRLTSRLRYFLNGQMTNFTWRKILKKNCHFSLLKSSQIVVGLQVNFLRLKREYDSYTSVVPKALFLKASQSIITISEAFFPKRKKNSTHTPFYYLFIYKQCRKITKCHRKPQG